MVVATPLLIKTLSSDNVPSAENLMVNKSGIKLLCSVTVVPHEKESEEILEETSVETPVESNE